MASTEKGKLENLKIHGPAKAKLKRVRKAIQREQGPNADEPSWTQTVNTVSDYYLENFKTTKANQEKV